MLLFAHRTYISIDPVPAHNIYVGCSTRLLPYVLRTPKPIIHEGQASQTFKDISLDLWGNWRRRKWSKDLHTWDNWIFWAL